MNSTTTRSAARRFLPALAVAAAALLALGACAAPAATSDDEHGGGEHDDRNQAETTLVEDAWVKAVDSGMTSAFAVLGNDGHHDAVLVAAQTPAAESVELHEVVVGDDGSSTMRELEGGFVIAPEQSLVLEPGGLHLMLMGVNAPLLPGEEIEIVLEFADGSSQSVTWVVKEFSGAEEDYGAEHDEHSDEH